jgi:protease secretion system outer membrane protein
MLITPYRSSSWHLQTPTIKLRLLGALLASCVYAPGHALSLMESYKAALDNDPKFQGARFDKAAGEENRAIGLSGLLPSVGASYNFSKNDSDRTTTSPTGVTQKDNPQYDSKVMSFSLRQPLFNMDAWQRYKGGEKQVSYTDAKFASDAHDLITRLTTAYLDALLAESQLLLTIAQRDAYFENQILNTQMFEKGAGTRTDMLETRARYELAQAQVAEAEGNVISRRNEFAVIIGRDPGALDSLVGMLPELPVSPATLLEWEQLARERNPEVLSQRYAFEYSQTEVERIRAGHYPRVDFVASQSRNTAESLYTYNQQSTTNSVGIQMSLPIYSGGLVNAQTRQAAAKLASSRADLDSTLQKTLVEVRKQFLLVSSARIRIRAMQQAELAAAETVEATRKSVAGGQRVNVDVLNAMQQLYTTRRDLADARHSYLLAYLRLHAAAGVLDEKSLGTIATCFQANP